MTKILFENVSQVTVDPITLGVATRIAEVYRDLREAVTGHAYAAEDKIRHEQRLDEVVTVGLATGDIQGKNQKEREGDARRLYGPLFDAVENAERNERQAKLALDLARLHVEEVRAQLRLMELSAAVQASEHENH